MGTRKIKKKTWISIILSIILTLTLLQDLTLAASGTKIEMMDGIIYMNMTGKVATSGIRYKTVGWIIHKEKPSKLGEVYTSNIPKAYIKGDAFEEVRAESHPDGTITTYFEIAKDDVNLAMIQAGMGEWAENQTIYLSSIMVAIRVENGKEVWKSREYYNLSGIKGAQAWASPDDLDEYYDLPIIYKGGYHPIYKEIKVNGKLVEGPTFVTEGLAKSTHPVNFPPEIIHNGKRAVLKKTYFEWNMRRGTPVQVQITSSDPPPLNVTNRNVTIPIGGITVIANYEYNPTVTVEHMDLDTNDMLETKSYEVESGTTVSESSKSFSGKQYIYSEISVDGGKTWAQRSNKSTRSLPINVDTIIRFYYSSNVDLMALLNLTANPDQIEKGKTATVNFLLDASGSKAKNGISKYEFWFSSTKDFKTTPDYTITSATKTVIQANVEPNTTWYGKVRITDTKGNTSIAFAEVFIGELEPKPTAEVEAALELNVVQDTARILSFDNSWGDECFIEIFVPNDSKDKNGRYEDVELKFTLDASDSTSTNGVGDYKFELTNSNSIIYQGPNAITEAFEVEFVYGPQDVINGGYSNQFFDASMGFKVTATDRIVTTATDDADVTLYYKYVFEKDVPGVKLNINKNDFGIGETALFTPTFIENESTYEIKNKWWEIYGKENEFKVSGDGEIVKSYPLNVDSGPYIARQYISYIDSKNLEQTAYAEVVFNVWDIGPPDVKIESDKEKYVIPTTGYFTVTYFENSYTLPIDDTTYKLKTKDGITIAEGIGTFPNIYNFTIDMDGGLYIAEQTIYWYDAGQLKSKTAQCEFKLISPKPTADFEVNMKMTNIPTWKRIDLLGESGKQYKQIRIDLTPSIALNESLENPHKIDFTSPNTQIQILPLTDGLQADRSKNNTIHTPNGNDKQLIDNTITFNSKQFIDVRFDSPGKYRIKTRVANQYYTSNWVVRDIIIREDLPPLIDLEVIGKFEEEGIRKVYRDINSLAANFDVIANPKSQDEDTINYSSAKLEIRYDYNYDNDTSNDDVHSKMYITQSVDNLQPYITGTKSYDMSKFNFNMNSSTFAMLGKVRFEYSVSEIPTIPNFNGGTMPAAPVLSGNSYNVPINKKVLMIENRAGTITVEMGKEGKVEIYLIETTQEFPSDIVQGVIREYREKGKVYIIHMDGSKELLN